MPTAMMLTAPPGKLTGKDLTPGPGSSIIFAAAALISKLFNPTRLPARQSKQPRLRSQHPRTCSRALAPAHLQPRTGTGARTARPWPGGATCAGSDAGKACKAVQRKQPRLPENAAMCGRALEVWCSVFKDLMLIH